MRRQVVVAALHWNDIIDTDIGSNAQNTILRQSSQIVGVLQDALLWHLTAIEYSFRRPRAVQRFPPLRPRRRPIANASAVAMKALGYRTPLGYASHKWAEACCSLPSTCI